MARGGKVQAEMGGKNPVIVLDDADLNTAVEMVTRGAMRSTGQKCTATSRVYVQKGIFGTFADALAARVRGLKVGDGIAADTYLGPSVSAAQRDIVMDYIQVGQREGAKIAAGGEPFQESDHAKGYFVPPTVFVDAPPNARIMREEIFGPVVALAAVDTLDTALKAANDIPYGLSASLISRDIGQIMRFIDGIQAGLVHVNDETAGAEPQVPFGGFKESGTFGREQGKTAREFYTQVKTVYMDYPG
jgi:aldehyde dehydrogenase (NAD+)